MRRRKKDRERKNRRRKRNDKDSFGKRVTRTLEGREKISDKNRVRIKISKGGQRNKGRIRRADENTAIGKG
jgi:hypothetical protein